MKVEIERQILTVIIGNEETVPSKMSQKLFIQPYSWQEKLPLVKTPLESTWLRHEIGRCHLEMGNFTEARDYGEQALEAAKEAEDEVWQLNSSVLIAQADGMFDFMIYLFKFCMVLQYDTFGAFEIGIGEVPLTLTETDIFPAVYCC